MNKFDINGKLIEKNDYDSEGDLLSKSAYTYDAKGNLITRIVSDREIRSDVGLFSNRNKCYYDWKGNLIQLQYLYWPLEDDTYKYDEWGSLIQEKSIHLDSYPYINIIYKYEYDSKGNWIKRNKFENGIQTDYTEREIEYY